MNAARIRERLRKLLAVAGDAAASPGEVKNALKLARAIMAEHHLSPEDVSNPEPMGFVTCDLDRRDSPAWVTTLAAFTARFVGGVRALRSAKHDGIRWNVSIDFVGRTSEAQLAAHIFQGLRHAITTSAKARGFGSVFGAAGRDYGYGFAIGLSRRLELTARNASPALAVIESRKTREAMQFAESIQGQRIKQRATPAPPADACAVALGITDGRAHQVDTTRPPAAQLPAPIQEPRTC